LVPKDATTEPKKLTQ